MEPFCENSQRLKYFNILAETLPKLCKKLKALKNLIHMHSVHWGINRSPAPRPSKTPLPLSRQTPPLNLQTFQASPLFTQFFTIYSFFVTLPPPEKSDFSVNPHRIQIFYP